MADQYEDIINLPHPVSKRHPQMSMEERAAQFAPFAALTGHGEAIRKTAEDTARELSFPKIHWIACGCVITTHGGTGCFGLSGFGKKKNTTVSSANR